MMAFAATGWGCNGAARRTSDVTTLDAHDAASADRDDDTPPGDGPASFDEGPQEVHCDSACTSQVPDPFPPPSANSCSGLPAWCGAALCGNGTRDTCHCHRSRLNFLSAWQAGPW
jgi:hypothetical protein